MSNAYRIVDSQICAIVDNYAESVRNHLATVEQSGTSYDGTGAVLVPRGNRVSGNRSRSVGLGVKIQGTGNILGINTDENGADFIYLPAAPALVAASTYGNFTRDDGTRELNPNPFLELSGSGVGNNVKLTQASAYPEARTSSTTPPGVPRGIVANDDSTTSNQAIRFEVSTAQHDRTYGRVWLRKGTAKSASIVVEEYDSAGTWLNATFYGVTSPVAWTEYVFGHRTSAASASTLRIGLVPATSTNDNAATGTTEFAHFRLSRTAIGR